jgi:hypothetical protein
MAAIQFRCVHGVHDLWVKKDESFRFAYDVPHEVCVTIRAATSEDKIVRVGDAYCLATSQVEPDSASTEIFRRIAANEMVDPTSDLSFVGNYPRPDGSRIYLPARSRFPEAFRSFIGAVGSELRDFSYRTVFALRWRMDELGPHSPMSWRDTDWSYDGAFWHPFPTDNSVSYVPHKTLAPKETVIGDVTKAVMEGGGEPFHHNLFREAWELKERSPRSALVIGMASAELATKRCISTLIPGAEWLATNVQSPPLVRMLVKYLPQLPAVCKIDDVVKSPPKEVIRKINAGVELRNQLAHAGPVQLPRQDVEEILRAVHDVLLMLDFYSGHAWALEHLRDETKLALGIVAKN